MDEFETMKIAYEIGIYMFTFIAKNKYDNSKPYLISNDWFKHGPNLGDFQTKKGLILEEYYGYPCKIHTPYGEWKIFEIGGDSKQMMESLKKDLGLVIRKSDFNLSEKIHGPYWNITKWKNKKLPNPEYKKSNEITEYEECKQKFEIFKKKLNI